jgi:hypothetical protein
MPRSVAALHRRRALEGRRAVIIAEAAAAAAAASAAEEYCQFRCLAGNVDAGTPNRSARHAMTLHASLACAQTSKHCTCSSPAAVDVLAGIQVADQPLVIHTEQRPFW